MTQLPVMAATWAPVGESASQEVFSWTAYGGGGVDHYQLHGRDVSGARQPYTANDFHFDLPAKLSLSRTLVRGRDLMPGWWSLFAVAVGPTGVLLASTYEYDFHVGQGSTGVSDGKFGADRWLVGGVWHVTTPFETWYAAWAGHSFATDFPTRVLDNYGASAPAAPAEGLPGYCPLVSPGAWTGAFVPDILPRQ